MGDANRTIPRRAVFVGADGVRVGPGSRLRRGAPMSASAAEIVHLRDLFRRVWPEAIGGTPSRGALQVALGICGVEGWGHWGGEMAGSNNFGGDQTSSEAGNGVTYYGVPHTDHHYDGT